MKTLTIQQVLFIHSRLITETRGTAGLRDIGLLESAMARPFASFDGKDLYPGLFTKASAMLDSLVNNHPFLDGNKRVGVTSAALFLRINGYLLKCAQDELESITMLVATNHPPIDEISAWFKDHCITI